MLVNYVKGYIIGKAVNTFGSDSTLLYGAEPSGIGDIIVPQGVKTFSSNAISEVPLANQTSDQLSRLLVEELNIKGPVGNTITPMDISWKADSSFLNLYSKGDFWQGGDVIGDGIETASTEIPTSMIAIVHDPALQQIAIGCIVIFSILFSIGIWRLWKNRKPKF
jgi:hypothetical protein